MSELIAITYPDEGSAADVLAALRRLQAEGIVQFDDACVVTRDAAGGLQLHQRLDAVTDSATRTTLRGALLGALVFVPLVSLTIGAAIAHAGNTVSGLGVDERFLKGLGERLEPRTSTVFLFIRRARAPEHVLGELSRLGGRLLHASLGRDAEQRLRVALSSAAAPES